MDPNLISPQESCIYTQYSKSSSEALNVCEEGLFSRVLSFVLVTLHLKMKLICFIIEKLHCTLLWGAIYVNSYNNV